MFDKRFSAIAGGVGAALALVAGLAVSFGIVRATDDVPAAVPTPAATIQPPAVDAVPVQFRQSVRSAERVGASPVEVQSITPVVESSEEVRVASDRLVLVGDSLAGEIAPVLRMATPGVEFVRKFMGGTAPCDWIDVDLEATPTSVVVITFTGNNLTPCMFDDTGVGLVDEALVEQYRADVGVLIEQAADAGARVVLVGQPYRHPAFEAELEVDGINAVYEQYAAALPRVSFVDAGQYVETSDGAYADRLPCVDLDTDCAADGTTVVRGDGVHFCPVVDAAWCPVYSSGATRFGLGIAAAANDPATFD